MSSSDDRKDYSPRNEEKFAATIHSKTSLPSNIEGVAALTSDSSPEERPIFRSALRKPTSLARTKNYPSAPQRATREENVINKEMFIKPSIPFQQTATATVSNWIVNNDNLRRVPNYYPLEKSSRFVSDTTATEIANRISESCRIMSVQALYNGDQATASLRTAEHVDIEISLWQGEAPTYPNCVIVEAQRRKGDAVVFHKYCRFLLDAAQGDFDTRTFARKEQYEYKFNHVANEILEEKESSSSGPSDRENSLFALEIASGLLKKDRMDARQLGMESLCLLTDLSRTGLDTAVLASKVVLMGTIEDDNYDDNELIPEELGIREAILSLIQFGRLGEGGEFSSYDSDDEDGFTHPDEERHNNLLHNLALAVLSNALEVLQIHSAKIVSKKSKASLTNTFIDESNDVSNKDLLRTLLGDLEQAKDKPHDARLSAKCLKCLFQASQKARRKARNLNAKEIVITALDVGRRTHVKLEEETEKVMTALQKPDDDDEEE
jgi:hypothetical protein